MTQVIAVADTAKRQARLAASLSAAFSQAGQDLQLRTHRQLVAEVSVEQVVGQQPVVDPDRPLLWLSPGDAHSPRTPDERFVASEAYAAARSIAVLTRSPVLNRPSAVSPCGTLPAGPAVAVHRARRHDAEAVVRPERFTGSWRPDDDTDVTQLEVLDYATGRRSFGRAPSAKGPFRRRTAVERADFVKVRVVGDRTITTADVAPATLAASQRIASRYGLDLATLWWLIGKDDGARTLARIDGWAFDAGFGDDIEEVAAAVAAWMGERLGWPAA